MIPKVLSPQPFWCERAPVDGHAQRSGGSGSGRADFLPSPLMEGRTLSREVGSDAAGHRSPETASHAAEHLRDRGG